jgi:hypothetical protein
MLYLESFKEFTSGDKSLQDVFNIIKKRLKANNNNDSENEHLLVIEDAIQKFKKLEDLELNSLYELKDLLNDMRDRLEFHGDEEKEFIKDIKKIKKKVKKFIEKKKSPESSKKE